MQSNHSLRLDHSFGGQPMPRLLFVFPCLNEEACLEKLVRSFVEELKDISAHFVIVDGGSDDRTPQIAQQLADGNQRISFLNNPKRFQSGAVNLAVKMFGDQADYLIRIDVHADYPEGFSRALVHEAVTRSADSVVVSMSSEGFTPFQKSVAVAQNSLLGNGGSRHRCENPEGCWVDHGHHALVRIGAFRAVGGYDETFSHNEDAELDFRLAKAGYRIWLTNATNMTYFPRSTPWALFIQYLSYGVGRARNVIKNRVPLKLRQLVPLSVMPATLLLMLVPVHVTFAIPFLTWAAFCLLYGHGLAKRDPMANGLLIGLSSMIMHWGWSLGIFCGVFMFRPKG